jgi:alkylation response protein AidB-like acyl-CoA dehydrogenase
MRSTAATELGLVAAEAVHEIARRAVAGRPVAEYAETDPLPWEVVDEGGWDRIGVDEADGGGGASLRDLVELAEAWGAWCLPSPLLETVVARRWSAAARETPDPVTVAIETPGLDSGTGLAPFAAMPGVMVARSLGSDTDVFKTADETTPEPFAPTLRSAVVPWVTELPEQAIHELRVLWAAETVGAAQRLLDLAVQYARDRVQFGKPIGSFQAVKHQLADMHIETQVADSAVLWACVEPEQARRAVSFAVDAAVRVAQSAIQVHGAMGFTWEMGLHFYLRSMLLRRELVSKA